MSIDNDWKTRALGLIGTFNRRSDLFERYRQIFFMENMEKARAAGVDKKDWKLTPSPNGRNEVVGMHRLLDTGDIQIEVKSKDGGRVDQLEDGLKAIIKASGTNGLASVTSDAMLSAVLYGPVVLYAESVDDLLAAKTLKPYRRRHLEKLRARTPFVVRTINPEESFPELDDGQLIFHVWKHKLSGAVIKSRFGVSQADDKKDYTVYDCFDPEYHYVWADGLKDPLIEGEHGLNCVPIALSYSGGTNLFTDPHHQIQSFLYAKVMGNLDARENSVLTSIFTQLHRRGMLGEMYWIDPESAPETIKIDYQDGVFYAKGKVTAKSDRIIDPVVFEIKGLLDELSGQSTIYKQTLGENIATSTFSGLAMLSSAGKLPLVSPERALEAAFRDICEHILYRVKEEGIENDLVPPQDVVENLDISVTFAPKLPQDQLRNAQVATQIGDKVSTEWIHSNLLQINDTPAMEKAIMREQMKKAIFQFMVQDPATMQKIVASITGAPPPPSPNGMQPGGDPSQNGNMPPEGMPMDPEMMDPAMMGGMEGMPPGVPGNPNMIQAGQSGPMIPPQERM
jgi:hypothetical protein